jgi:hypothetical protein
MTTLFKTEFGSRLYGTHTEASDHDYKEVYLPDLKQLVVGMRLKNTVHNTNPGDRKNEVGDIDVERIPFQVFARDFIGGQTYALEIAFACRSNAGTHVDSRFFEACLHLSDYYLTANVQSMIGYALSQAHRYGIRGSRMATVYKFRDIAQKYSGDPLRKLRDIPAFVEEVRAAQDKYLKLDTYEGANGEDAPCIILLEKIYPLDIQMQEAFRRIEKLLSQYGVRTEATMEANGVDWKSVSHALRISQQALDILTTGNLVFPLEPKEHREYVLAVKQGKRPWDEVAEVIAQILEKIEVAKETTRLPQRTPELYEEFEAWLGDFTMNLYGLR